MKIKYFSIKAKGILIISVLLCLTLCSCGKTQINSKSDEVIQNSWRFEGEYGITASLEFENENAALSIENSDESCVIEGLCICDDEHIVIIDKKLKKEFVFEYALYGDRITVIYDGAPIDFVKV